MLRVSKHIRPQLLTNYLNIKIIGSRVFVSLAAVTALSVKYLPHAKILKSLVDLSFEIS